MSETFTLDPETELALIADANQALTETPTPAPRALSFTVVHGYLRGEHACAFELHATGCKDLRSKQAKQLFNYEVLAPDQEAGIDAAVESLAGTATRKDIWVQPCTLLKRMKAIGRA